MGRKKKAKKLIREAIKEQKKSNPKSPKKAKNKINEKSKKPEKQKSEKISFPIKKLLALIAFIFFSTTTVFLISLTFKATDIAHFLPENTVLVFSLNSDFDNLQNQKAINSLSTNPLFSRKNLEKQIGDFFAVSFEDKIKPWLGRNTGLILLRTEKQDLSPIFFIEVKSTKKALESLGLGNDNRQIIPIPKYFFPKNNYLEKPEFLTIIDSYLFFAPESKELTELLKIQRPEITKLFNSSAYQNIKNNSPSKKIASLFVNNKLLNSTDLTKLEDLLNIEIPKEFILSLFAFYESEGISIYEEDSAFVLSAFTNLKNSINQKENFLSQKLISKIPKETKVYFLTDSLLKELNDFMEISNLDISSPLANTLSRSLFSQITFEDNIKPIIQHESILFAVNNEKKGIILSNTTEESQKKLEDIIFLLSQANAGFEKELVSRTLPDKTQFNEYIKIPKIITLESIDHKNSKYYFYSQNQKPVNIYFAFIDDYSIVVSDPELIVEIIENIQTKISNEPIEKLHKTNNILYLDLAETLPSPFNPFKNLSIESSFVNGGIFSKTILKTK